MPTKKGGLIPGCWLAAWLLAGCLLAGWLLAACLPGWLAGSVGLLGGGFSVLSQASQPDTSYYSFYKI